MLMCGLSHNVYIDPTTRDSPSTGRTTDCECALSTRGQFARRRVADQFCRYPLYRNSIRELDDGGTPTAIHASSGCVPRRGANFKSGR